MPKRLRTEAFTAADFDGDQVQQDEIEAVELTMTPAQKSILKMWKDSFDMQTNLLTEAEKVKMSMKRALLEYQRELALAQRTIDMLRRNPRG